MRKLSFIFAFLISGMLFAQDEFEGEIKFGINYEDLAEEMAAYKSMLPSESTLEVKGDFSKMVTPNAMGGETTIILDQSSGEQLTLANQMGNKFAIKSNIKDQDLSEVEIEYVDETKEILGYKCKKAIVTGQGETEIEIFYTEELGDISFSGNAIKVKGFPMQTTMTQGDMFTMIQTVEKIEKKKIKKIKMDVPSDFEVKTIEEIKKMQQGM